MAAEQHQGPSDGIAPDEPEQAERERVARELPRLERDDRCDRGHPERREPARAEERPHLGQAQQLAGRAGGGGGATDSRVAAGPSSWTGRDRGGVPHDVTSHPRYERGRTVRMPRLQAKSFATPDSVRTSSNVRFETCQRDEATVGHCRFEPGWRWSTEFGPQLGLTSCPIRHLGYSISGSVRVRMDDGETLDIGLGMVFDIPPGHDQWVIGDEPWVTIEWGASGRALSEALEESTDRSLTTVLFTDIVDSTAKLRQYGDAAWRDLLAAHNVRLREAAEPLPRARGQDDGRWISSPSSTARLVPSDAPPRWCDRPGGSTSTSGWA